MKYQTLAKLYYGDQSAYAQEYKSRFEGEDTVRIDFTIGQKQAFFVQNAELMKLAYEIEKLDKSVSDLSRNLPGVAKKQYSRKCLIDEIVLTNKIEGVHSSRKEIGEALDILNKQSQEIGKQHRFVGLVNKYLKLLTGEKLPLTECKDIRDIYDEVILEEVISENPNNTPDGKIFRKDLTEVHSSTDKVIHKGMYPESEIISAMEKALTFLNDESVDMLLRICVFHYMIEYIHPFYDGNGRLGRFILSYCLSQRLEPLLAYKISETIKENISAYYKAFSTCNDPHNLGDLTPFLIMMLTMIREALEQLEKSLTDKSMRWHKYEELVCTVIENIEGREFQLYSILIQASLFSEKGVSTDELKDLLNVSYGTVKKVLDRIKPELLISEKKGREKYYELNLQLLDDMILEAELKRISN